MQLSLFLGCKDSHSEVSFRRRGRTQPLTSGYLWVAGGLCYGGSKDNGSVFDGFRGGMSTTRAEISTILMDKVADWLTQSALAGDELETLVKGFCERLAAAGLPLKRVHLSFSMLHPLYDALG